MKALTDEECESKMYNIVGYGGFAIESVYSFVQVYHIFVFQIVYAQRTSGIDPKSHTKFNSFDLRSLNNLLL